MRPRRRLSVLLALCYGPAMTSFLAADETHAGLTAVAGIRVGHHTLSERPTGCTVILAEAGAVAGVDVRGGAPATRETDLLDPSKTIREVHAVVLSGGSAFGLDAASGVMRYLEARGIGFDTGVARVPIVPAASLFDLHVGGRPGVRPDAECGARAAEAASAGQVPEGSVGAGAGATVGKLLGPGRAMKAGVGTAAITLEDGLVVAALVAVNAIGQINDPATGAPMAGLRSEDGASIVDLRPLVRAGALGRPLPEGENTTLGVVATNARLTKAQARKVAEMAHDGLARTLYPAHLPLDGDAIFALATGAHDQPAEVAVIGALAADVVAEAILRAATQATGLPGLPAARDLAPPGR
jgi:L-aminopeptidase/D-esterase-like protein